MRIIVTGGAGFIGSHIVDAYIDAGHEVLVIDSLWEHGGGRRINVRNGVSLVHMDVRDEAIARVFADFKPDVVSHHAAQHSVAISSRDPIYDAQVNVVGLLNVLEQSVRSGARKVIFASSGATYGTPERAADHRSDAAAPDVALRHHEDGRRTLSALLSRKQGAGLHRAALRQRLRPAPGSERRGRRYRDLQRAVHRAASPSASTGTASRRATTSTSRTSRVPTSAALERGSGECYVIGTGVPTSVNEIYRALVGVSGFEAPIERAPQRPGDARDAQFDASKAAAELEWSATTPLEQGIAATYAYFQKIAR